MPLTRFPNGVSSYGMPVIGAGVHMTTGDVFFVSSTATNSSDGNLGDSPEKPLATLNGALTRASANNGDIVFFMPNHAENVTSATTQVIDKAGIKFIGLGTGTDMPTFTYTNVAGSFQVDSANSYFENFVFNASVAGVVLAVAVDADHVTFMNCRWGFDEEGTDAFDRMIYAVNVDHVRIENCEFYSSLTQTDTTNQEAFFVANTDHFRFIGNVVFGEWLTTIFHGSASTDTENYRTGFFPGTTRLSKDMMILYNNMFNNLADTSLFSATLGFNIDLNSADLGLLAYNNFGTIANAAGTGNMLDPGSLICIENYANDAIDKTAIIIPTAVAITAT